MKIDDDVAIGAGHHPPGGDGPVRGHRGQALHRPQGDGPLASLLENLTDDPIALLYLTKC